MGISLARIFFFASSIVFRDTSSSSSLASHSCVSENKAGRMASCLSSSHLFALASRMNPRRYVSGSSPLYPFGFNIAASIEKQQATLGLSLATPLILSSISSGFGSLLTPLIREDFHFHQSFRKYESQYPTADVGCRLIFYIFGHHHHSLPKTHRTSPQLNIQIAPSIFHQSQVSTTTNTHRQQPIRLDLTSSSHQPYKPRPNWFAGDADS